MPEQKEFHELFAQTNGRIFALLISTDGRGHFDSRGRLALDYCAAGQTFDLPKGMFDSDAYRDTDVVLTFAKLEQDGEYLLVDVHSVKGSKQTGTIHYDGNEFPLRQFFDTYQNRITIHAESAHSVYPQMLSFDDFFYALCAVGGTAQTTINNSALRENLFRAWFATQGKPSNYPDKLNDLASSHYIITKSNGVQAIQDVLGESYGNIYEVADAKRLQTLKDDWKEAKKVYYVKPTNKEEKDNPQETSGAASTALQFYINFLRQSPKPIDRNLIYFGAPGTGKSYKLNEDLQQFEGRYERVTFYSDYLHAQFVGSFRPKAITNGKDDAGFTYAFTPGPFTRMLIDALNDESEQEHVLVIEEINRADPASVFGDIFQLLDRNDDGNSTYPITVSEDMKTYLLAHLDDTGRRRLTEITGQHYDATGEAPKSLSIALPSNMLIWATMNSADQGVYPMDTAFKRRWNFRYISINDGETDADGKPNINTSWNTYRRKINKLLLTKAKVAEDKLLGPFFLGSPNLAPGTDEFNEAFKNKVIMYLFEDAARYKRTEIFNEAKVKEANGNSYMGLTLNALFAAWDHLSHEEDTNEFDIFKFGNE